jgi:hypothetical protein
MFCLTLPGPDYTREPLVSLTIHSSSLLDKFWSKNKFIVMFFTSTEKTTQIWLQKMTTYFDYKNTTNIMLWPFCDTFANLLSLSALVVLTNICCDAWQTFHRTKIDFCWYAKKSIFTTNSKTPQNWLETVILLAEKESVDFIFCAEYTAYYINNKKANECYAKVCKFEAHLDKRKDEPNRYGTIWHDMTRYPQNSIGGHLGILIFVDKYLTFTISPDFAIWVFHWDWRFTRSI